MTAGGNSWATATVLTVGDAPAATLVADLTEGTARPYWQAWWTFTADKNRRIVIDTLESVLGSATRMDTWLQVFTGPDYASRVLVVENDDAAPEAGIAVSGDLGQGGASWLTFNASAGTTYHIACGSYDTTTDVVESYVLTMDWGDGPANDRFAFRTPVSLNSGFFTDTVDATLATTQPGEPTDIVAWSGTMTRTVWYEYQQTVTAPLRINTAGSLNGTAPADTVVTLYTQSEPGSVYVNGGLSLLEQDPDEDFTTDMTVTLDPGTYFIQVGVWDDAGPFTFTTTFTGPIATGVDLGGSGYAYDGTGLVDQLVTTVAGGEARHPVRFVHVALPTPTIVNGRPTT